MTTAHAGPHRFADAAAVLGVSDDTVRRWAEQGRFAPTRDGGALAIAGADLARLAVESASVTHPEASSARNRLRGVVTAVIRDTVMAQVEMACGPYRIVSLLSREAADDLGLEPGVIAVASVKATNVVLELPR